MNLPAVGAVHASASGAPYLAVSLTFDPTVIGSLLPDLPRTGADDVAAGGFSVAPVTPELLDAWERMLRLMERPDDIPALAQAYEREILYRVLQGPHAAMLRDIATPDTALAQINLAIQWIGRHFAEPLRVEALAAMAAMSSSSCHRHFKADGAQPAAVPKAHPRLLQARTLLVSGGLNATSVAFDVGYGSATQFSREYARFFGAPPAKDAARIIRELQCPAPCPGSALSERVQHGGPLHKKPPAFHWIRQPRADAR